MFGFQAGWKENHATFMSELKNLQASGLTTLGQALRSSFDLLNLNRLGLFPLFYYIFLLSLGFLITQSVKKLPTMQKTRVPSLDWEDPLEEEMATNSSILV